MTNELWSLLEGAAPEQAFFDDLRSRRSWSYGELSSDALAVAGALARRGVGPGDRVAFLTVSSYAFFPLLLACAARGASLVPLNAKLHPDERAAVLDSARPRVTLVGATAVLGDLPGAEPVTAVLSESGSGEVADCAPDTDALVVYTSGTTSGSKGVVLTHRNLSRMARTFVEVYGLRSGQRFLCLLPHYHINAPMITGLACVAAGAHVHLSDPYGFTNARRVFELAEQHRLEVLSLTPSIMASLLQLFPDGTTSRLDSVQFALVGTAHLPEDVWRRFEAVFGFPCYQGYGLTETTTWATLTPPDARKRYDTAGVPIGCEVSVDGDPTGEVLIRGDIVMKGYLGAPEATRRVFKGDWFRTGDVGRFDEDGQLCIVGRIKNVIKRRGVLLHPEEIDAAAVRHPEVAAACTVGIRDGLLGERVVTAVEGPAVPDGVRAHLRERMSAHKLPDEIVRLAALPRNAIGKPDLSTLRALVSGELGSQVVQRLTRYKYSRAKPDDPGAIENLVRAWLFDGQPLRIVGYWGVDRRRGLIEADERALARLRELLDDVAALVPGSGPELTLVLADVHGRCNGVPEDVMADYFAAIAGACGRLDFRHRMLSDVWGRHGLPGTDAVAQAFESARTADGFEADWEHERLRPALVRQAHARCPPGRDPEQHAQRYWWTCRAEGPAVAREYAGWLFFTYSPPAHRSLLPPMPTLYLHSLKPGVARKPWFESEAPGTARP